MRNEGGGFAAFIPHSTFLPPSFGRRCPEGGGSWLSMRDEVVGSTVFPVIPLLTSFLDRKRKRFLAFARNDDAGRRHTPSFLWKEVPRRGGGWLSMRDEVVGSTVFPMIPLLTSFLDRKRKRFLAFARNDDAGRRHTPSFLRKEVPRRKEVGSRCGIFTRGDANPASLRSSAPSSGRGENDS